MQPRRPPMDDYNYHDWSEFMVERPEKAPTGPHYAAVLFDRRTEYVPAYDSHDSDSTNVVSFVSYFAFPDSETLKQWVLRATKASMKFFFFQVTALGRAEVKVDINVDVGG